MDAYEGTISLEDLGPAMVNLQIRSHHKVLRQDRARCVLEQRRTASNTPTPIGVTTAAVTAELPAVVGQTDVARTVTVDRVPRRGRRAGASQPGRCRLGLVRRSGPLQFSPLGIVSRTSEGVQPFEKGSREEDNRERAWAGHCFLCSTLRILPVLSSTPSVPSSRKRRWNRPPETHFRRIATQ